MGSENKVRIAVLVSGGGTNLQALIDAQKAGIIKHGKISLVISNNPEAFAITRAEQANIPSEIISQNSANFVRGGSGSSRPTVVQ